MKPPAEKQPIEATQFVRDMHRMHAAILAAPSSAERQRLEAKQAAYLRAHARGEPAVAFGIEDIAE